MKEIVPVELKENFLKKNKNYNEETEMKRKFIDKFSSQGTQLYDTLQHVGITKGKFDKWMKTDLSFKDMVDTINERVVSAAHSVLLDELLYNKNVDVAKFIVSKFDKSIAKEQVAQNIFTDKVNILNNLDKDQLKEAIDIKRKSQALEH